MLITKFRSRRRPRIIRRLLAVFVGRRPPTRGVEDQLSDRRPESTTPDALDTAIADRQTETQEARAMSRTPESVDCFLRAIATLSAPTAA